jgi:hypothetical protein
MGACHTFYDELRFDVRDPHLTHVYVYIRCQGDCPHFIQGWHHKAFPSTMSTKEIFDNLWSGNDDSDPVMWPLKAPPSYERNNTLDEVVKVVADDAAAHAIETGTAVSPLWDIARKLEGMKT